MHGRQYWNTGHFWGPGTSFLRVQWPHWLGTALGVVTLRRSATRISEAGSPPVPSGKAEHIIPTNSLVRGAQWHPSRSHPGGMEEGLHVPGWPGTAMASHMRSDSGPLEGSTSLKRLSCRKVPPSNEHDKVSPGGNASHCRHVTFLPPPCWVCIKARSSSEGRRGEKCGLCIKKKCVRAVSNENTWLLSCQPTIQELVLLALRCCLKVWWSSNAHRRRPF